MAQAIDYDALAAQARATAPAGTDYDALEAQAKGANQSVPPTVPTPSSAPYQGFQASAIAAASTGDPVSYGVGQMAEGALKGAASTARNVAHLLPQSWQDQLSALRQRLGLPSVAQVTQPTNTFQSAGKMGEQAAEFLIPGAFLDHVLPAAGLAMKIAVHGAGNAAVAKAQGAGNTGATIAGLLGAAAPVVGAMASSAAPKTAEKIETVVLKPTARDFQNGFHPANIFKYNVGGSLDDTLTKTTTALNETYGKLKDVLGSSPSSVNLDEALTDTAANLRASSARNFGQNSGIQKALEKFGEEIRLLPPDANVPPGQFNLLTTNQVKQGVGELGAWLHDPTGRVIADPESKATETVANAFYDVLKKRIEAAAPPGEVAALNKQLSELIPIRAAAIRRIPVAARNEVLSLGDLIGLSTGHIPVSAAARIMKSGQFANLLANGPAIGQGLTTGLSVGGGLSGASVPSQQGSR